LIKIRGAVTEVDTTSGEDTRVRSAIAGIAGTKTQLINIHSVVPYTSCTRRCGTVIY